MNEQLQINLAEQIRTVFQEANKLADDARGVASEAVAKAIECGQLLLQQKESLGHGSWLEWLELNLPEISDTTARRYMRIAKMAPTLCDAQVSENQESNQSPVADLEHAQTLKHAYIALGILPQPENKKDQPPDPNKPWVRFTKFLDGFRLWFNKRIDDDPLNTWPEDSRRILKNELRWFAELYERL